MGVVWAELMITSNDFMHLRKITLECTGEAQLKMAGLSDSPDVSCDYQTSHVTTRRVM